MPLQNRLRPDGKIVKEIEYGTLMGNRGILHNENKELVSNSKIKGWVTCKLEFKGRKRELMAKSRYTELFFLDEATAFSAGHRPCAECRRDRYNEFKTKWLEANIDLLDKQKTTISNIDKIIHLERINKKEKVTFTEYLDNLPTGTMIKINENIYLIWNMKLYKWDFKGYKESQLKIDSIKVNVLTPFSYVKMFKKGFIPQVHKSLEYN